MYTNNSFRYSLKKFNDSLDVLGGIRVGTLYDFRKSEHSDGIGDPEEGTKRVSHHIKDSYMEDSNDPKNLTNINFRALEEFNMTKFENFKHIRFRNVTVSQKFDVDDLFIFCSSKEKSVATMKCFDGANSCLEITKPDNFYRELTKAINYLVPVIYRGCFQVAYQDRVEQWNGKNWGDHPALIKGVEFEDQQEIRAIWSPKRKTYEIKPIILSNYRLASCVEYRKVQF